MSSSPEGSTRSNSLCTFLGTSLILSSLVSSWMPSVESGDGGQRAWAACACAASLEFSSSLFAALPHSWGNFLGCAPCAKPCALLGVQFQCRSRAFTMGSLVCARSRVSWFLCESLYNRSFIPGVKLPRHLTRAEADSLVTLCVSESYDSRQRQR